MADYSEKQKFIKAVYEDFYKVYNPKAADKLGVVYTPNEVVDFMIRGTDHLLREAFRDGGWPMKTFKSWTPLRGRARSLPT